MNSICFVEPSEAADLATECLRCWRAVLAMASYRPSARKFLAINARLERIREEVAEFYDLPRTQPSKTSISAVSYEVEARHQLHHLTALAERLIGADDGLRLLPQEMLRRTFISTAVSAGQFMDAPLHSVADGSNVDTDDSNGSAQA